MYANEPKGLKLINNTNAIRKAVSKLSTPVWGMRMVSEDYLGLNDQQLVLAVSHSKLLKSHLSFKYKCFNRILIVKYCFPIIMSLLN